MISFDYTGAFIVGLMGAGHCFGMCGGLIAAFSSQSTKVTIGENLLVKQLGLQLSYNFGRIFSYAIAGALLGGSAASLADIFDIDDYLVWLRVFAGLMMLITGLYLAQFWFGLTKVEAVGQWFWSLVKPTATKLLPIETKPKAVVAGLVWGWLPCGLVYSTLTWSIASGSALKGGLIMAAFGLGTLPALLTAGMAAKTLAVWLQNKSIRMLSGGLVFLFGIQTLFIAYQQLI
ncbi:MAG: sulfite exporter TauE/SafE family protein [Parashewanella sp.]